MQSRPKTKRKKSPLSTTHESPALEQVASEQAKLAAPTPRRERLPDLRESVTHKFSFAEHEGYLTVGIYADGRPGEIFLKMAKQGSMLSGLLDTIGILASLCLQYGVPVEALARKFEYMRFEPAGLTQNPDIRVAHSVVDYVFRWVGLRYSEPYREQHHNGVFEASAKQE